MPLCSADRPEDCRDGYVAEYDARTLSRRGEYRFFDADFYGALRELVCLGDVVQVTMNHVRLGDRTYTANVMDFRADDPSQFRRTIFPDAALGLQGVELPGHRVAYDRTRDAVFSSDSAAMTDRSSALTFIDEPKGQIAEEMPDGRDAV